MPSPPPLRAFKGLSPDTLEQRLFDHYQSLLEEGVPSSEILCVLEGATLQRWQERLKGTTSGPRRLFTLDGFLKSELVQWWPLVDARLPDEGRGLAPLVVPVDLAQYLMAHFTGDYREQTRCFEAARSPVFLQNVQLLDTLARAAENGITLQEAEKRLQEAFGPSELVVGVKPCLELYQGAMLRHRLFDHGLLLAIACRHLLPDPIYQRAWPYQTVLIESADEWPPSLVERLAQLGTPAVVTLKEVSGLKSYLGADPGAVGEYYNVTIEPVGDPLPLNPVGRALYEALVRDIPVDQPHPRVDVRLDFLTFDEMLLGAAERIDKWLLDGVPPHQIALVVPAIDPFLVWRLREAIRTPLYVFAGTHRLVDFRPVRLLLALALLRLKDPRLPPEPLAVLELLEVVTGLDPLTLARHATTLLQGGKLAPLEVFALNLPGATPFQASAYRHVSEWCDEPDFGEQPFSHTLRQAFETVWTFLPRPETPAEAERWRRDISQVGQLVEVAERFERLIERLGMHDQPVRAFLNFLYGGTIAERPFFRREPHRESVVLATASQMALRGETVQHQIWLDVPSSRWWKSDQRELTNIRVLARSWPGGRYDGERDRLDQCDKLGKVLWMCTLKVQETLTLLGSLTDLEGREQTGELADLVMGMVHR